ncbi:SMP-30/gluconolactonase/LRE family protein [Pelomonas sp. UHG3]|uniref:SMP-30/gluconolactonase/LRE family protein n=1 Tax=Roseateles hydrophilus TaxID=2975054 RepID=A0ACC6CE89_9BURK|nr:SMP-30/gluconolactonase/LRE family protein [Pelomonas sp. UHG3]MCY4746728.1 SMP-30/gluconolactonase/LRE family protein [Pelomonas sp. UHG3]
MSHVHGPAIPFQPASRLPDAAFEILAPEGRELRLFSACVEQLATGLQWAEGPVWFGDGRYLLWSDIPNDRILRWDDCSGQVSVFRQPAGNANGHARDAQGRLISCEHLGRRITRTEFDGRITVLADRFDGKPLNSPNDITVAPDGAIWFTDPEFGISGDWEGAPAEREQPHGVYRLDGQTGELQRAIDDLAGPNGLAFTPEGRLLVVESRAQPHRLIWSYAVSGATVSDKRLLIDAQGPGAFDGIALDTQGRIWCGFGGGGQPGVDPAPLDGVRVYSPQGQPLAHIHLPERCANLCFGGAKGNRLFMASSHSLYALYVHARGLVR